MSLMEPTVTLLAVTPGVEELPPVVAVEPVVLVELELVALPQPARITAATSADIVRAR
jgi:hypothetical protein